MDSKEIKPVIPKGNQPWIFTERTDAEVLILWPPDVKSQLIGKDPDAGKDWRQEEKGTTEEEMVGWHQQLNRHEFEQTRRWRTGKPGMLQFMGSQRVGHNLATEGQQQKAKFVGWDLNTPPEYIEVDYIPEFINFMGSLNLADNWFFGGGGYYWMKSTP